MPRIGWKQPTVSILKIRRTIARNFSSADADKIINMLVPKLPEVNGLELRIGRKIKKRAEAELALHGRCGLMVNRKKNKIMVISAKGIEITAFNFQNNSILKKALRIVKNGHNK